MRVHTDYTNGVPDLPAAVFYTLAPPGDRPRFEGNPKRSFGAAGQQAGRQQHHQSTQSAESPSRFGEFPTTDVQTGPSLAWEGTIIAPNADVVLQAGMQLRGSVIADSITGNGTLRNYPLARDVQLP